MVVIVVDGNIGSGKSTLLNKLSPEFTVFKEKIDEWPLAEFYNDPSRWSLPLQIRILQTMQKPVSDEIVFHERCPSTSNNVFWAHIKQNHISSIEDIIYQDVYEKYHWEPDIYIYLRSSPINCFNNISKRVQVGDCDITLQYITELHHLYEKHISNIPGAFIVDANEDADTVYQNVINFVRNQ
jgi:deoxyadenosine/deoxycytidine kinase